VKEEFMREAIRLSLEKMRGGFGGPFGAVVVRNGEIISRGWNQVTTAQDPTAHAEVVAIREACQTLKTFQLGGCEIYASCEPCPMCLGAIYWARLDKLYFAGSRLDAAEAGFDDAFLYQEFCQPPAGRKIETIQFLREEALAGLREWTTTPNGIRY
jgi:guanine deaminase